jgi:hypothetical protein
LSSSTTWNSSGPSHLAGLARTAVQRVVTGDRLAGAGRREHRQKQGQIGQPRHHLFDAEQRDHGLGQRAVSRALPSFSVMDIMPVSAMAKLRR